MQARPESAAGEDSAANEVARLRACLNDLGSLMALPALRAGGDTGRIVDALLDALLGMLDVSFLFARVHQPEGGAPIETVRLSDSSRDSSQTGKALRSFLDESWPNCPPSAPVWIDGEQVWVASALLGLQGELGVVIAGTSRASFPDQTERLLLEGGANHAATARRRRTGCRPVRARTRDEGDDAERVDRFHRARSEPATFGDHHQRQYLPAHAGSRSSRRYRRARNRTANDSRQQSRSGRRQASARPVR